MIKFNVSVPLLSTGCVRNLYIIYINIIIMRYIGGWNDVLLPHILVKGVGPLCYGIIAL